MQYIVDLRFVSWILGKYKEMYFKIPSDIIPSKFLFSYNKAAKDLMYSEYLKI